MRLGIVALQGDVSEQRVDGFRWCHTAVSLRHEHFHRWRNHSLVAVHSDLKHQVNDDDERFSKHSRELRKVVEYRKPERQCDK